MPFRLFRWDGRQKAVTFGLKSIFTGQCDVPIPWVLKCLFDGKGTYRLRFMQCRR